jgi:hypothetical protein
MWDLSSISGVSVNDSLALAQDIHVKVNDDLLRLPKEHQQLLLRSNGLSAFWGYFRLWGVADAPSPTIEEWNAPQIWKFAWGSKADDFLCFGCTAFGDQYAYSVRELREGGTSAVYFVDGINLEAWKISDGFAEFMSNQFLRNARDPYDHMIKKAFSQEGPLGWSQLLVLEPSLHLGGQEDTARIVKFDIRTAMIINGDIFTQMSSLPDEATVHGVEAYTDQLDRMRLRIVSNAPGHHA